MLTRITVTFTDEGAVEYAVRYSHDGEIPNPGTKGRTATAARMAAAGLKRALEGLEQGTSWTWGGFSTDTRQSEDRIMLEAKPEENPA